MRQLFTRYSDDMLRAVSNQSVLSIAINSIVRGIVFTIILQLIAYASIGQVSSPLQMLVLVVVFGFIVFSVDLIERAWAQHSLSRRG